MIEWRYRLSPVTPRDAAANNLAEVLTFGAPNLDAPQWDVPGVFVLPCFVQSGLTADEAQENADWAKLRKAAINAGWRLKPR